MVRNQSAAIVGRNGHNINTGASGGGETAMGGVARGGEGVRHEVRLSQQGQQQLLAS